MDEENGRVTTLVGYAINAIVELVKYRTVVSNKADLDMIMSGTAIEVFGLKV